MIVNGLPTRNLSDPTRARTVQDLEDGMKAPTYDQIVIPELFGPVKVLVDEKKVRRFSFTQDDNENLDSVADLPVRLIAPAGLLANDLLQMFTTKYAPSQVVGLHTEEQLWFRQPVMIGEVVTLSASFVDKFVKRGQGCVVMEAEARNEKGELLVSHRGVEIMRTAPAEVGGRGSTGGGSGRTVNPYYDAALPGIGTLDHDVLVGMHLDPIEKETTMEQVAVFSRIGEFVRSTHTDLRTVHENGMYLPIVQGQQLVCYMTELLTRAFGISWHRGGELHAKFLKPVKVFETLSIEGVITDINIDGDRKFFDLDLWVKSRDETLHAIGWARGWIPFKGKD